MANVRRYKYTLIAFLVISSFISLSMFETKDGTCFGRASFTYDPKYPDVGEKITFTSTGSGYDESWTFGDGAGGSGSTVTHTYEKKGNYTVTLRVEYIDYEYNPETHLMEPITSYDYASQFVNVGFPYPSFNYNPQKPIAGENVEFDASQSTDPVGEILYYNWSYIDTRDPYNVVQMGNGVTLTYMWARQGTYSVTVTETDDKNNVNGMTKTIVVSVLSVGEITTRRKNINIQVQNIGNLTAQDVTWNVRINKVFFNFWRKYSKSGTIGSISPGDSATISLSRYKRFFGFVKVTVTVESDNAKVTVVRYGFMIGRYIHLRPVKS